VIAVKLQSLKDLFVDQLQDLYSAENQLVRALPKMAKASSSEPLAQAFEEHLEQTKTQASRLETVFEQLHLKPRRKKCKAMEGLIKEGSEVLHEDGAPSVLDAALIAAAQRIEHYEIAGYGCARTFATLLGNEEAVKLLNQTLEEEKQADTKLTELAMRGINQAAERAAPEAAVASSTGGSEQSLEGVSN
jgi:ferritin-like metal-binding protein YciE